MLFVGERERGLRIKLHAAIVKTPRIVFLNILQLGLWRRLLKDLPFDGAEILALREINAFLLPLGN